MDKLDVSEWLWLIQSSALVAGGLWALFVYRSSRRAEAQVAIEHSARLVHEFLPHKSLLLVTVRLRNTSAVLWRFADAAVTLFDARKLSTDGSVRLVGFSEADPFLPVYGVMPDDPRSLFGGEPFAYFDGQQITLEPGEQVESELAFPLDTGKLGLMGVRIWFSGKQRRFPRQPYEWATFFYIDPRETGSLPTVPHSETARLR